MMMAKTELYCNDNKNYKNSKAVESFAYNRVKCI
jgi:hypothetical protein